MSEIKRCALLDADFISKLYSTKIHEEDRFIQHIINIDEFNYVCHKHTEIELAGQGNSIPEWLKSTSKIKVYTDRELIELMVSIFGSAAYMTYISMLRKSCNIFSSSFFERYYQELEVFVIESWNNCNIDKFESLIISCDKNIGQDNNLGEIKLYTMAQILEYSGVENFYVFCSDDRKARYILSCNTNIDCISALASFYLAKKYLNMNKNQVQSYFDSWMELHKTKNQDKFQVYTKSGHQLEKIHGQEILDMIYTDELMLMKDGYFRKV